VMAMEMDVLRRVGIQRENPEAADEFSAG